MSQDKFAITEQIRLLSKLYPHFKPVLADCIDEVNEFDAVLTGSPMSRVFRAIDQGHQLETEIERRTGLDKSKLKMLLTEMVEAGALRAVPQGGKTDGARGARKMLYERAQSVAVQNAG